MDVLLLQGGKRICACLHFVAGRMRAARNACLCDGEPIALSADSGVQLFMHSMLAARIS